MNEELRHGYRQAGYTFTGTTSDDARDGGRSLGALRLGAIALAGLWALSYLPLVGVYFGYVLEVILWALRTARDVLVWLVVFAVKSMITLLVVAFVTGAFKQNLVRIGLVTAFVAWFWTGWFDTPPASARHDSEVQSAIEFGEAWQRMRLWNEWHSNYFRQ